MRPRDLAAVLFAILGVYVLVGVLENITYLPSTIYHSTDRDEGIWAVLFAYGLQLIVQGLIASTLILGRFRFADRLFGAQSRSDESVDLPTSAALAAALIAAVGLWIAIEAFSVAGHMLTASVLVFNDPAYAGMAGGRAVDVWPERIAVFIRFVAGVAMFAGARGLAQWWSRIRPLADSGDRDGTNTSTM